MSDAVTAAGIDWENHSDPANLDRWGVPDLVVVGNQTRPANLELEAVRRARHPVRQRDRVLRVARRRPHCGSPSAAPTARPPRRRCSSTSSSARAWTPGFRLGSTSLDLGGTSRLGTGPFVFEGDEYTSAPWDPRPKFLHTRPHGACVTRLELDHPDVYASLDAYREPFVELAATMPADGVLALCADDPECLALRDARHQCCGHLWHEGGKRLVDPRARDEQTACSGSAWSGATAAPLDVRADLPRAAQRAERVRGADPRRVRRCRRGGRGRGVRRLPRAGASLPDPRRVRRGRGRRRLRASSDRGRRPRSTPRGSATRDAASSPSTRRTPTRA